jgi:glycerol-3-phosphate acyltransferase PlsY
MPLAVMLLGDGNVSIIVTLIIAVVVIAKHHENIRRLLAGTESRFKA